MERHFPHFSLVEDHENNHHDLPADDPESVVPSTDQHSSSSTIEKRPSRPVILLKRIPLAEANQYLPGACEPRKKIFVDFHSEKENFLFQQNQNVEENVKTKTHQSSPLIQRKPKGISQLENHHQFKMKVHVFNQINKAIVFHD